MTQEELYHNLTESASLQEVQRYIYEVIHLRGFDKQTIEQEMLIMLEEVGELAKAIRKDVTDLKVDQRQLNHYTSIESEVADVFIMLASICNQLHIDMFTALKEKEKINYKRVWKNMEK